MVGLVVDPARRGLQPPRPMAADDVIDDGAGLMDREFAVGDHRRLAQGVNLTKGVRRQPGLSVTLIGLDPVIDAQFLQEPEDALRARVVEVVDDDHDGLLMTAYIV